MGLLCSDEAFVRLIDRPYNVERNAGRPGPSLKISSYESVQVNRLSAGVECGHAGLSEQEGTT